ncbi:uncharacterized protein J3D65DRAFT_672733 [Phyllosticta citribraziliensis]|uniref:Polyketide cyclase/dehydrase/lipid transport protein n=1 Tax=Phyllosticta citribraziliensis TaxID=989973 RepID=A0ABR1L1N8_9PEZI
MSASFVPSSSQSVFTPSYSIPINAHPGAVFALLTSRSTWKDWNGFVPHAHVLKASPNPSAPRSGPQDDALQVGQVLKFEVRTRIWGHEVTVPGGSAEEITSLSTPEDTGSSERGVYRVCWDVWGMPPWLLKTCRVNEVVVEGDGQGTEGERCTYRTYMTFEGPMAYFVKWLTGWMVKDGLKVWGEGLKKAAEAGLRA